MSTYQKEFTYNGSTITLTAAMDTGTVSSDDPTPTHTVTLTIAGTAGEDIIVSTPQLPAYLARLEADAKASVDNITNAQLSSTLVGLGYDLV